MTFKQRKISLIGEESEKESKSPIVDLSTIKPEIDRRFKEGHKRGEKTYFYPIDCIRNFTWMKGKSYCITGNPQSGKTEFINQLAILKSKNDGWKWDIYSPEGYPVEEVIETFLHTLAGRTADPFYTNQQMSEVEKDKWYTWIQKHFNFYDFDETPTLEDIEHALNYSKNRDGIIIDPFNSLDTPNDLIMSERLKKGLTRCNSLCRKYNLAWVIIEHPSGGNEIDEETNQPKEPTEYKLYGGSMWRNKMDYIAVVHRPFIRDKENTKVTFRTVKIKNQKLLGYPDVCEFHFNRITNRYFYNTEFGESKTGFDGGLIPMSDIEPDEPGF